MVSFGVPLNWRIEPEVTLEVGAFFKNPPAYRRKHIEILEREHFQHWKGHLEPKTKVTNFLKKMVTY